MDLNLVAIVTICTTMITMFQLYPGSDESTTPVAKNRVGNAEGKPNNILVIPPVIDAFQSTKVPAPLYVPPITVIKTEPVPIGAKVNDKGQVIPLGPKTDTQQKTEEPKQEETKVEDEKKKEEMEKMKTPSKWAREDEAFVFLLTNDKPMHLIWALEGSLRDVKSTRRRIALCTPAVPGGTKDTLRKLGMEVIDIEQPRHKNFKTEFDHWADTLAKLFIFQLQGIRQFVYLDADTMVNKNVDYLFQKDTNAKVYAMTDVIDCVNGNPHLNAGLIVARPNITLRNELFGLLEDPNFFKSRKGDQEMLDVYLERQYVSSSPSFRSKQAVQPYFCTLHAPKKTTERYFFDSELNFLKIHAYFHRQCLIFNPF